ncbi:hypothetical protein RMSM_02426 [Rhodopirellula maiorica SM1]|uniref:Uncharacterized protein n=1 Tax=Rhodopirellula maiorica SM1 TaxID=1265738 RepID=M5RMV2_9BACT|nr:hypothetical protein RMSM_02426 [Rhodopirellula maiorica SM1]
MTIARDHTDIKRPTVPRRKELGTSVAGRTAEQSAQSHFSCVLQCQTALATGETMSRIEAVRKV